MGPELFKDDRQMRKLKFASRNVANASKIMLQVCLLIQRRTDLKYCLPFNSCFCKTS
jgi:hypothetical protein